MALLRGFAPQITRPLSTWSHQDQSDWSRGFPADEIEAAMISSPPPPLISPKMHALVLQAMERFRFFLSTKMPDELELPLALQVNRKTVTGFREFLDTAVSDRTIVDYLTRIQIAGFRLAPHAEFDWLARMIVDIGYVIPEPAALPTSTYQLYKAGIDAMEAALLALDDWRRNHGTRNYQPRAAIEYRDGLLVAMLALIAARIASLLDIRLSKKNFAMRTATSPYGIVITDFKSKTHRKQLDDIPEELTPFIDVYLDQIRPLFCGSQSSDAFWIVAGGEPLTYQGAFVSFKRTVSRRLGLRLSPHKARHLLADTMRRAGASDADISETLGHFSLGTASRHYISKPRLGPRTLLARISGI